MKSTTFTIDAALLRELGDRLIGRSYIALAELVKNSYDADATECRIEFSTDTITVSDNGHGMSEREFHDHWMRIGTTPQVREKNVETPSSADDWVERTWASVRPVLSR